MTDKIERVPLSALKPYARNPRAHSKKQIKDIANSIREFGFLVPMLLRDDGEIIAGHARVEAAKLLGMDAVPAVRASHLTPEQAKAYRIADNRLAETSSWDTLVLAAELQGLIDLDFKVELTGFAIAEIDTIILEADEAKVDKTDRPEDRVPEPPASAVTKAGDVWVLGPHRLLCGDARSAGSYAPLMVGERADMVFTDSPYNCPIDGFVGGGGQVKHREFAMASGEMSNDEFTDFLTDTTQCMAAVCKDGAIFFSCMDWRNIARLIEAGERVGLELKNLIAWVKTNGGQGAFYRSQHELIAAFKVGQAPHTNTFGLGDTGRYRTNVWQYAGVNSFRKGRMDELAMHPTVKPVQMVKDAILDVTRRGEIVLDGFGGSGTTLIAAQMCGRRARLVELDPIYCDVICQRWQAVTGTAAIRQADGLTFEDAAEAVEREAA